jgi:hypothetical protein
MFNTSNENSGNLPFVPFKDVQKQLQEEAQNSPKEIFQDGPLKGNPKPPAKPIIDFTDISDYAPKTSQDIDIYRDFVREAANNANANGKIVDSQGKEKELKGSWYDTMEGKFAGFNDWKYMAPVRQDESGQWVDDTSYNPTTGYMRKFDDEQKYAFLYPVYDENGQATLKEFIGTKAEMQSAQIAALNTFGPAERNEGLMTSFAKGLSKTVLSTDDLVAGFVKFGTQPSRWVSEALFRAMGDSPEEASYYANNSWFAKAIDGFYKDTIEDSNQNDYVASQKASDAFSADWVGSGVGNALGSIAQFGGIGRGIRLSAGLFNAGAKQLGIDLLKRETATLLSTYGSSAVLGFGAGFNEAKANGLSDDMAFAFALPVGLINTIVETKLGENLDKYLVGGLSGNIAKELFNETGGKILSEKALAKVVNKVAEKMSSKALLETAKNAGSEGLEEMIQEGNEQLWRTTFNAFALTGNKGEGKFKEDGINLGAIAESGFFGTVASGPSSYRAALAESRSYGYQPDKVIESYVAQGKKDQLISGLDELLAKKVITQDQYNEKIDRIKKFDRVEQLAKKNKANFGNAFPQFLKHEFTQLNLQKFEIEESLTNLWNTEGQKLASGEFDPKSLKKEAQEKLGGYQKQINELDKKINLYYSPEYIGMRSTQIKELADSVSSANRFARTRKFFVNLNQLKTKALNRLKNKSGNTTADVAPDDMPVVITPEELKAVVDAVKAGDPDAGITIDANWLNENPIYLSDLFGPDDLAVLAQFGVNVPMPQTTQSNKPQEGQTQTKPEEQGQLQAEGQAVSVTEPITPNPIAENPDVSQQTQGEQTSTEAQDSLINPVEATTQEPIAQQQPVQTQQTEDTTSSPVEVVLTPEQQELQRVAQLVSKLKNFDQLNSLLKKNPEITKTSIKAADQTQVAMSFLKPEQQLLYKKLLGSNSYPHSVILLDSAGSKKEGRYVRNLYATFVKVDLTKLNTIRQKIEAGIESQKDWLDYQQIQNDFFHLLMHEGTHALFDGELTKLHKQAVDGDVHAQRAWKRYTDLATTAYEALKNNPAAKNLYFFSPLVAQKYQNMTGARKMTFSLDFVHEFFAEALSNRSFMELLNGVNLDTSDPTLRAIIDENYAYADVPPRSTLWNEIVKAVVSVFPSLRDKLSLSDRTLLAEAYNMASQLNIDIDPIVEPAPVNSPDAVEITNLDIFRYEPFALFGRNESINASDLASEIQARVSVFNLPFDDKFDKKLRASLQKGIGLNFVDGTFKPIFFRSTNTYMVSWQADNGDGTQGTRRIFIDSWGNLTSINTNVFNTVDPVDFSKPSVYEPFMQANKQSSYWESKREMLNAFDRAHKEEFQGRSWLTYDPDYEFVIGRGTDYQKKVKGQVQVNYQFADGSTAVIGYVHDLAKIKLGRLLSTGASIELDLKVKPGAMGSTLRVKRNENGAITDVKSLKELVEGYQVEEGLFPAIDVRYKSTNVSKEVSDASIKADSFTHYDEAIPVETREDRQDMQPEEIVREIEEENGFKEVQPVNEEATVVDFIMPDAVKLRIETNKDLVYRRARYRRAWFNLEENDLKDFIISTSLSLIENIKQSEIQNYGPQIGPSIDLFGMSQDEYSQWVKDVHDKVVDETANASQTQDGQDWDGNGFNPVNTIAPRIKWDIERLLFVDPNLNRVVPMDFTDASDILYDATQFATTIEQVIANLEKVGNDPGQSIRNRNIAGTLAKNYKNYLGDKLPQSEKDEFTKAVPSLLSQLGSYRRTEAIIFQPVADSNAVKGFYPNQSKEFRKVEQELVTKIENYVSDLKAIQLPEGRKPSSVLWSEGNKIFNITSAMRTGDDKLSPVKVLKLINRYLNNDTLVTGINAKAIYDSLNAKEKMFMSRYVNPSTGLFIDEPGKDGYQMLTKHMEDFLRMIGIEDFPFHLMSRTRIEGSEQFINEQIEENKKKVVNQSLNELEEFQKTDPSEQALEAKKAEIRKEAQKKLNRFRRDIQNSVPLYKYHTVTVSRNQSESSEKTTSVERTVPIAEFAVQLSRFAYTTVESAADGNTVPIAKRLGELKTLAEIVQNYREGRNTPPFYMDASQSKRWSRRIRNWTDDLMEKLSKNIDGMMHRYMKADIHKDNNVLAAIAKNNGEPIDVYFAGVKNSEGVDGSTYSDMDNGDYIFAQLSGFVTMPDKYWHMDKTPSDKPGTYMYKLFKIDTAQYENEIEKLKGIEEVRAQRASLRFNEAFEPVYKKDENGKAIKNSKGLRVVDYYAIKDQAKFNNLVERADYKGKDGKYYKGDLHDRAKYWYGGKSTEATLAKLKEEAQKFYDKLIQDKVKIPVSSAFENEYNPNLTYQRAASEGSEFEVTEQAKLQYQNLLQKEQEKIVKQWYINSAINQFHLEMLVQGDPLYYKDSVDTSKRMAGARGPIQHHVMQGTFKLASLRDIDGGKTPVMLPSISVDADGNAVITEPTEKAETNRGDAQGYVTEDFARRLTEAYGTLAGYGQIFKPLLFGVQPQHIEDNRPSYLKLSLFVVPDPYNPNNLKYYQDQPDMMQFAMKMYGETGNAVDIAVFESGIKVGMSNVSNYDDPFYATQDMDLSMLGFQNNPKHITDEDSDISGMSQGKKISGNMSPNLAKIAYEIEARMINGKVDKALEKLTPDGIIQTAYESLSARNHTAEIAEALKSGLSVDNPIFGTMIENLVNSSFASATEYLRLPGNKLVNVSELGMNRPGLTQEQIELYNQIAESVGDRTLRWAGPRKVDELLPFQLEEYQYGLEAGIYSLDSNGNILQEKEGKWYPKVFPAEVLVPASMGSIGEKLLATRIPTSGPQSIIPAVIVGHLPSELVSGNTIVSPKEGPGILGFDFDVDGLFTWRKGGNKAMKQMFDIYFEIFTDPNNYNDITEAISTDTFNDLLFDPKKSDEQNKERLLGREGSEYDPSSPATQILYRDLNKIGKKFIGISAVAANIHNVFSSYHKMGKTIEILGKVSKYVNLPRSINIGSIIYRQYVSTYVDMVTGEVKPIAPVMATMVNLATDNAKLQKLFKLGLTLENAGIFFDFVLKGIDPKYPLYLLNQPIVKEYEKLALSEKRVSQKYSGNEAYRDLVAKYEGIISNLTGQQYRYASRVMVSPTNQVDVSVSFDDLKIMLERSVMGTDSPMQNDVEYMKQQLLVLEKYRYYSKISKITNQLGALIRLDSSYPKTFLEAASRYEQIGKGFDKSNVSQLVGLEREETDFGVIYKEIKDNHPIYKMHYRALTELINAYSGVKAIAEQDVFSRLYPFMEGLSSDNQKKIEEHYKNYLVQSKTDYNSSLLGKKMTNYHFVDWSSRIIADLMNDPSYAGNEFFKLLTAEIVLKSNHDRIINQQIKPSTIKANTLGKEFTKKQVDAIHKAYLSLPTEYQHPEFDQPIDIQKLLVANILYTKGLGMGGFNFTQLLPVDIIKSLDSAIDLSDSRDLRIKATAFSKQLIQNMKFLQRDIKNDELEGLRTLVRMQKKVDLNRIKVTYDVKSRRNPGFNFLWDNLSEYRGVWVPQKDGSKALYTKESVQISEYEYEHYLVKLDAPKQNFVAEFYPAADPVAEDMSQEIENTIAVAEQIINAVNKGSLANDPQEKPIQENEEISQQQTEPKEQPGEPQAPEPINEKAVGKATLIKANKKLEYTLFNSVFGKDITKKGYKVTIAELPDVELYITNEYVGTDGNPVTKKAWQIESVLPEKGVITVANYGTTIAETLEKFADDLNYKYMYSAQAREKLATVGIYLDPRLMPPAEDTDESQEGILNYYEDVVGYKQRDTPMDDMTLAEQVIYYRFGDLANDIWSANSTINPDDVYDPNFVDSATRQPYTYQQIIDQIMGQYRAEEGELFQLADKIDNNNYLGRDANGNYVTSTKDLAVMHHFMARNFNTADGLAKKEFANLFRKVADELVNRRVMEHIAKNNISPDVLKNQRDIGRFSNFTTSVAEVSANQAALQAESKRIDAAKYMTDTETNKVVGKLRILLNNVYKAHFASQSDQWHRRFRFWENHKRHNEPFLWLYEKDQFGEYTGRFIQKYDYRTKAKTQEFLDMELAATQNTPEGELAKAKLALYDFLETEGNKLLQENDYTNIPQDRAFMPHLGVDMEEAYSRYGMSGAYLAFSGVEDYNDILNKVIVTDNGKTQSVGQWRIDLVEVTGKFTDNKANIDRFAAILDNARQQVKNGTSGLSRYDIEQMESFESSFSVSSKIPFRAVMRKKRFSINTSRILVQHFTQLIFKKYHDPVLTELQATAMHYQMKSKNPKDFENINNFIELYGNRYFFGKKDAFSNSKAGKTLEVLSSVTVSAFLGFAPTNALLNMVGGLTEVYKNNIENYGWAEGTTKFGVGMKRLLAEGKREYRSPSEAVPRVVFNPKALALAERFNIENFSQIDTEQEGSAWARFTKFAMQLQRSSEIAVRVASFLGELTQEQWDNYVLDPNGQILIKDPSIAPTIEDVNRWKYYVSSKQGFYDPAQRYNYSYYGIAKGVMLFKNWMLSFFKERFYLDPKNKELNYADLDRYGRMRQGYYVSGAMVAKDYLVHLAKFKSIMGFRPLNEMEQANLRKLIFDVGILVTLLALGNIGDDDEEEGYWTNFVNKLNSQLYFSLTPAEWVKTLKQPTPSLSIIENLVSALANLASLKAEKAGNNLIKAIPGGNIVEGVIDLAQSEENE